MKFFRYPLDQCANAKGLVVVIDVIRAFTTAAYAFSKGAKRIIPVSRVKYALDLKRKIKNSLIMGEVNGLPIDEFDFGNSPDAIQKIDLTGKNIIQRTSNGTQGIVGSVGADMILATSFCCAGATVHYIVDQKPDQVSFVITGKYSGRSADEDEACADFIETLLSGKTPAKEKFINRIYRSEAAKKFLDPALTDFPEQDLACCADIDRFDFAMPVFRQDDLLIIKHMKME